MTLYVSGTRAPSALPAYGAQASPLWWETNYGRWRLRAEVEAMRSRFPDFTLTQPPGEILFLRWEGWLWSSLDPKSSYLLHVTYPSAFPDEPPLVHIEEPHLAPDTPHMLVGRRPCLYHPIQGPRNGYDPARTTAATLVAWTALWIHAYETWRATGSWPGRQA